MSLNNETKKDSRRNFHLKVPEILRSLNIVYPVSIPKEIRKKRRRKGQGSEAPGKTLHFRVGQPCVQSELYNWPALWPGTSYSISLSLSFLTCERKGQDQPWRNVVKSQWDSVLEMQGQYQPLGTNIWARWTPQMWLSHMGNKIIQSKDSTAEESQPARAEHNS